MNGYDFLAPAYDSLARLVFGKTIRDSQTFFLNRIRGRAKVLILGGGTGWLLSELLRVNPDCEVWYVETSKRMLDMSKKCVDHGNVHFIHGTVEDVDVKSFDVVITNFFLDLFSDATLRNMVPLILSKSNKGVIWLAADFVDQGRRWQQLLLFVMYRFFRMFTAMEAKRLPLWGSVLVQSGLIKISTRHYYGEFIMSTMYGRLPERQPQD